MKLHGTGRLWIEFGRDIRLLVAALAVSVLCVGVVAGQTSAFTLQGKLNSLGNPANGNYDIRVKLFDSADGTGQIGSTVTVLSVPVAAGIFTTQLDFGAEAFTGGDRWIEISVSPAGQNNFITLTPRQKVTSAPYALQSSNASTADAAVDSMNLGGIPASQYVVTNDSRLSDARVPLPGSNDYIQNNMNIAQPGVNFRIGGTGSANILNATTQFNLGGFRVIGETNGSLFVGRGAGINTTGADNSFFGVSAGSATTTGAGNSFFGHGAAFTNTTGNDNSHFGNNAGTALTGSGNSFLGKRAGGNVGGSGDNNTFIGIETNFDLSNGTGSNNTLLGANSRIDFTTGGQVINFATAIGAGAAVGASNSVVLGRGVDSVQVPGTLNVAGTFGANIVNATTRFDLGNNRVLSISGSQAEPNSNLFAGVGAAVNNPTGTNNSFFGAHAGAVTTQGARNSFFGALAGFANTTGGGNAFFGFVAGSQNTTGSNNAFIGPGAGNTNISGANNIAIGNVAGTGNTTGNANIFIGALAGADADGLINATAIGARAKVAQSNSLVLGSINGINGADADTRVGIGTTAPQTKLHVKGDSEGIRIQGPGIGNANGAYLSFADAAGTQLGYIGDGSSGDNSMYITSYVGDVNLYTPTGAALTATSTGTVTMRGGPALPLNTAAQVFDNNNGPFKGLVARSLFMDATIGNGFDAFLASPVHVCARIETLGAGFGGYALVRCTTSFSSAENKTDIRPFSDGLSIIRRLNPVRFRWKKGGDDEVGLNAEDVAAVGPSLVTRNEKGEVEDVKENSLDVVFINAFKEQQLQIESQQRQIAILKQLVCRSNPDEAICKEEQK